MKKYRFTKPIPMPRGSHFGNNYWIFRSRKLLRRVTAFSNLEYDWLVSLEMNADVEYYCEQPLSVTLFDNNKEKTSVFDLWVLYKNGNEELQEIKYSNDLKDPGSRSSSQISLQRKWCYVNGFRYQTITEKEIYKGIYYIRNIHFLAGNAWRCPPVDRIIKTQIVDKISSSYETIGSLFDSKLLPEHKEMQVLSYLYFSGAVDFKDLPDTVLQFNTQVIAR